MQTHQKITQPDSHQHSVPMNPSHPIAITPAIQRVHHFIDQLRSRQAAEPLPPAGLIFGATGLGKTVAARAYLHLATSTTPQLMLALPPASTPVELAGQLALSLHDTRSARRARNDPVGVAAQVLKREQVGLLILDDANNLTRKLLRFIAKIRTGTSLTLILITSGQTAPNLTDDLANLETLLFPILTSAEVVETLLPALSPNGGPIDPANPQHRQLGEYLWQQVQPSVQTFRLVIQLLCLMEQPFTQAAIDAILRDRGNLHWSITPVTER